MESEIAKQALGLFDECTKILNGEFRDNEVFWLAYQRYKTIMAKLEELGFTITMKRYLSNKRVTILREELEIREINFILKLAPNSAKDGFYKSISRPTSKIYPGILPFLEGNQPTTDIYDEDLRWLKEKGLRLEGSPIVKTSGPEKWHFTPDQRHALLVALENHWNQLEINAKEVEIFIGRRDTWKRIIEHATQVWPSPDGSDRYVLCFLIECELKYLKVIREILIKSGGRVLNVCPDVKDGSLMETVAHVENKHLRPLEGWLDQNLEPKQ